MKLNYNLKTNHFKFFKDVFNLNYFLIIHNKMCEHHLKVAVNTSFYSFMTFPFIL